MYWWRESSHNFRVLANKLKYLQEGSLTWTRFYSFLDISQKPIGSKENSIGDSNSACQNTSTMYWWRESSHNFRVLANNLKYIEEGSLTWTRFYTFLDISQKPIGST